MKKARSWYFPDMARSTRNLPVPQFDLFGEPPAQGDAPLVHIETIRYRSRPRGWEIDAHRHDRLLQVIILRRGWAELRVDGHTARHAGPVILSVPPGVVHAYRFDPAVEGDVISLGEALFLAPADREIVALAGPLHAGPVVLLPAAPVMQALAALLAQLRAESRRLQPARHLMLGWLARSLLLWLYRLRMQGRESALPVASATAQLLRFRQLVERHCTAHRDIASYAQELGLTERSLRRLCRELAGMSPGRLIDERLVLEARRRLAYSNEGVSAIAYALGFEDPAYFSRFVRRLTGCAPLQLRRLSAGTSTARPGR
jgi:AraC family transcriptional activator of pobA